MSGQTVVIKRKKVVAGGGHHGGAWKVAYADFVTAMMAFFLLMWLLNATTEQQRKGLADYFDPSVPISPVSGGGSDALMGDDVLSAQQLATSEPPMAPRAGPVSDVTAALNAAVSRTGLTETDGRMRVTRTDDGTLIELLDGDERALFERGSAAASSELSALLGAVASVARESGLPVSITGHTDALRYDGERYSNWELSADRANAARRLLLAGGLPEAAVVEVVGKADRAPLTDDAGDAANRRIAIMLIGGGEAEPTAAGGPRALR